MGWTGNKFIEFFDEMYKVLCIFHRRKLTEIFHRKFLIMVNQIEGKRFLVQQAFRNECDIVFGGDCFDQFEFRWMFMENSCDLTECRNEFAKVFGGDWILMSIWLSKLQWDDCTNCINCGKLILIWPWPRCWLIG